MDDVEAEEMRLIVAGEDGVDGDDTRFGFSKGLRAVSLFEHWLLNFVKRMGFGIAIKPLRVRIIALQGIRPFVSF